MQSTPSASAKLRPERGHGREWIQAHLNDGRKAWFVIGNKEVEIRNLRNLGCLLSRDS